MTAGREWTASNLPLLFSIPYLKGVRFIMVTAYSSPECLLNVGDGSVNRLDEDWNSKGSATNQHADRKLNYTLLLCHHGYI